MKTKPLILLLISTFCIGFFTAIIIFQYELTVNVNLIHGIQPGLLKRK